MAPTEPLQATLYAEMLSHIKETDESVPYPNHGWLYTTRTVEGSSTPSTAAAKLSQRRRRNPDRRE